MGNKAKTENELLREIEDLRRKLEAAEEGRKESDRTLRHEIAERKQAEEAFEKVQKHTESIVETVREPLVVLTPDLIRRRFLLLISRVIGNQAAG